MFVKHPSNPVYGDAGTGTLFDAVVARQPEGGLRMDFSWRTKDSLAVAFSGDGVHWTAPRVTLPPEPSSCWEDLVNRNCVLKTGSTYKMWYTGQAHGNSYIGCAESADGLTFRRVQTAPVLFPEAPWEGASVMNPCVLYENGVYRMWYSAGETYEPNVLCYAESGDGLHWHKSARNPILEKDPLNAYERDRIGGCQVLPHKKYGYLVFYIGYRDINTACICAAASADGVTDFRRCRLNPLIAPTPGAWDADACYKPTALYDAEKDVWRIWYNGRAGNKEYIGLAEKQGDFTEEDFPAETAANLR